MKYLKYLLYVLMAVSAVIVVLFYTGEQTESSGTVALLLNWSLVLMLGCLAGAVCLPIFFSTGKGLTGSLIKIGVVVVLCAASYMFASGDPVQTTIPVEASDNALKLTDSGLIMTTILFVLAVVAILSGSVISTIRNR